MTATLQLILASSSPARLATLRSAGLDPQVIVSGVDEESVTADTPAALATMLSRLKAQAVFATVPLVPDQTKIIIGCDSVLEIDGVAYGKPGTPEVARQRWQLMRGRSGTLHTGHHVIISGPEGYSSSTACASTVVHFATLDDAEIQAYVATGEPLQVAGSFTLDGLGGAYVSGIEGDPHNVVGISLPLLRKLLAEHGLRWHQLWASPETNSLQAAN